MDDFSFPVSLLTFNENNVPHKTGINVFSSQIIRYGRICSSLNDFTEKTRNTFALLKNRGYTETELKLAAEKALHKHKYILRKFGLYSARQIVSSCLNSCI